MMLFYSIYPYDGMSQKKFGGVDVEKVQKYFEIEFELNQLMNQKKDSLEAIGKAWKSDFYIKVQYFRDACYRTKEMEDKLRAEGLALENFASIIEDSLQI